MTVKFSLHAGFVHQGSSQASDADAPAAKRGALVHQRPSLMTAGCAEAPRGKPAARTSVENCSTWTAAAMQAVLGGHGGAAEDAALERLATGARASESPVDIPWIKAARTSNSKTIVTVDELRAMCRK